MGNAGLRGEVGRLCSALCDGDIDDVDKRRLEELVSEHNEARRAYVRCMRLHAEMSHIGPRISELAITSSVPSVVPDHSRSDQPHAGAVASQGHGVHHEAEPGYPIRSRRSAAVDFLFDHPALTSVVAASILMILGLCTLGVIPLKWGPVVPEGPRTIATLSDLHGADWAEASADVALGCRLTAGDRLRLIAGWAELTFDDGVRVILEGPADYSLERLGKGRLAAGAATAHVPRGAEGFEMETPGVLVIDRGTSFGVEVGDISQTTDPLTTVHVFQGKVDVGFVTEAGTAADELHRLVRGEAAEFNRASNSVANVPATPERFAGTNWPPTDNASETRLWYYVLAHSEVNYLVPRDDSLARDWTRLAYDDSAWETGRAALGYEEAPSNYVNIIRTPLKPQAVSPDCTSIYLRIPFERIDELEITRLTLQMQYDDGFVAYLNGHEVARRRFEGTAAFNSMAEKYDDLQSMEYERIDITQFKHHLVLGQNLLAIHAMNCDATSTDMLISPIMTALTTAP